MFFDISGNFFVFIIWYIQNKFVILHREPAPGSACAFGWVCRHIKKAFITLCSDFLKSRKFQNLIRT